MYPHFIYISTGLKWLDPIDLPAYFTMLLFGFAISIYLLRRWAGRQGIDQALMTDLGLYIIIMGVVGGRILHVFADGKFMDYVNVCIEPSKVEWDVSKTACPTIGGTWDQAAGVCRPAAANCWAWAQLWNGGFVFYGGLVLAVAFGIWFIRRHRLPLLPLLDAGGWAVPFGLFWGRIGCFLGGCCFGERTDLPWGVSFPPYSPASDLHHHMGWIASRNEWSLPVHPTQLYEALFALALSAAILWWLGPRRRYQGQLFLAFVGGYAVFRFLVEFIRSDERGGIGSLSTSQIISLAALALVLWAAKRLRKAALIKIR